MKTRLDETNHMRKLMGLPLINEETEISEQDILVREIIKTQLIRKIEDLIVGGINSYDDLLYEIKRVIMRVINIIIQDFSKNNELPFNKKSLINHITRTMENHPQIRKYVSRNNMGRLMDIIKQELSSLKGTEDIVNNTIVANFDKERVSNDLANKTTIKDGVVHVPFAIDDFPTEDWDLYFEDFDVSNQKFGFTDYVVKKYGAGNKDAEEIWQEYQEAILHRIMDKN